MASMHRPFTVPLLCTFFLLLIITACGPAPTVVPTVSPIQADTPTSYQVPTTARTQTPYIITATALPSTPTPPQGVFFLSIADGGYFHLFAYSPQTLPLTRLTTGAWDDITPAISPDGHWLAFSSHRNGYWDLYRLDLLGGSGV